MSAFVKQAFIHQTGIIKYIAVTIENVDFKLLLYVGAGGAAGSIARYMTGLAISRFMTTPFPIATLSVNLLGSFIIGLLFGLASKGNAWLVNDGGLLLLATGFCGGFTTFSTFALEHISLLQKGQSTTAIIYMVLSLAGGLLLCKLGMSLTS
jgi:CrcB protein